MNIYIQDIKSSFLGKILAQNKKPMKIIMNTDKWELR